MLPVTVLKPLEQLHKGNMEEMIVSASYFLFLPAGLLKWTGNYGENKKFWFRESKKDKLFPRGGEEKHFLRQDYLRFS